MSHPHAPHLCPDLGRSADPFDHVAEAADDAVWLDRLARLLVDDVDSEVRVAARHARWTAPGRS
jgi:hypothetical protein